MVPEPSRPAREAPGLDEAALIRACQHGDQAAFAELYRRHANFAFGTAALIARDREVAAEAVQEAFIRVYRFLPRFDAARPFRPWLYRILVNEATGVRRRWARYPVPIDVWPETPGPETAETIALSRERAAAIWQAVNALPEPFRVTVILRYYTGLMEDEIAGTLGCRIGTVKSRLFRARGHLREPLAPFAPGFPVAEV